MSFVFRVPVIIISIIILVACLQPRPQSDTLAERPSTTADPETREETEEETQEDKKKLGPDITGDGPVIPYGDVLAVTEDDSHYYIAGDFTHVGWKTGPLAIVDTEGASLGEWPLTDGKVNAVIADGEGGWIVGGAFTVADHEDESHLVRVDGEGRVDDSWGGESVSSEVFHIISHDDFHFVLEEKGLRKLHRDDGRRVSAWESPEEIALAIEGYPDYLEGSEGFLTPIAIDDDYLFLATNSGRDPAAYALSLENGDIIWSRQLDYCTVTALASDNQERLYVAGACLQALDRSSGDGIEDFNRTIFVDPSQGHEDFMSSVYTLSVRDDELIAEGWIHLESEMGPNEADLGPAHALMVFSAIDGSLVSTSPTDEEEEEALFSKPVVEGGGIHSIAIAEGRIALGGDFRSAGGEKRNGLAAIAKSTGALGALGADLSLSGTVHSLIADEKYLYLGGEFEISLDEEESITNLAALSLEDGSLQRDRNPQGVNAAVRTMLLDEEHLIVGGDFQVVGGERRQGLAALNREDGSLSQKWNLEDSRVELGAFSLQTEREGNKVELTDFVGIAIFSTDDDSLFESRENPSIEEIEEVIIEGDEIFIRSSDSISAYRVQSDGLRKNWSRRVWDDSHRDVYINSSYKPYALTAMAIDEERLFIGGEFNMVGGVDRAYLAALDRKSGDVRIEWEPPELIFYEYEGFGSIRYQTHVSINEITVDGERLIVDGEFNYPQDPPMILDIASGNRVE